MKYEVPLTLMPYVLSSVCTRHRLFEKDDLPEWFGSRPSYFFEIERSGVRSSQSNSGTCDPVIGQRKTRLGALQSRCEIAVVTM